MGADPQIDSPRPWGGYSVLETGSGYCVKRLVVSPGQRLSKQRHRLRDEHWVVVQGRALALRGDQNHELTVNERFYIPRGAWHRLHNPGDEPLVIIEVQSGIADEDDIERIEDDYGRVGDGLRAQE